MKRALMLFGMAVALGGVLVAMWFITEDPSEIAAWVAEKPEPAPVPRPSATPFPPPPPVPVSLPTQPRECRGMTWGVRGQNGLTTWVGAIDQSTDAYQGDTPCSETRPLLCFQPGKRPQPKNYAFPALVAQIRWTGGAIALVPEVLGLELRSRETPDRMCAAKFGAGWRMAEFHEGGSWGFGAEGELPPDARFWVAIKDQRANPWDR